VSDTGVSIVAGGDREAYRPTARGGMLYDASLAGHADESLFDPERWRRHGTVEQQPGGRGSITYLRDAAHRWVLRHYRRGGAVARLLDDRYLFSGAERTRAFREWRLLHELAARSLPAPRPVAARYVRSGLFYRADLLTVELPARLTLAAALREGALDPRRWADVGRCIGAFHAQGVRHADLNAHNVVLGPTHEVYLLDFDRGRIVRRGAWEAAVLARLERSLQKVTRDLPADRFGPMQWEQLRSGLKMARSQFLGEHCP
jgi:3-deoxy-D-manno-octulosonic acid kinase